jgi:hypothetical protein
MTSPVSVSFDAAFTRAQGHPQIALIAKQDKFLDRQWVQRRFGSCTCTASWTAA